ncbi:hypothetical protein BN975_02181 [Mycolicibacterium farcinogenes]|uniref:PASTA domain-containing protein n=2 Tax=Mycolicibacterium senegalense TaxID=1796 RepID=A0A378W4T0_9MYCO|nr:MULTISPECIES: hypothetical protein [Mycolicibacterium]MCV7335534.1 hypothetical protein [Mycolicibacterium senegalense]MDR7288597.1 hypothetical protein [Mycolicibacterium senegalense]QZA25521.1 hypothetical protein K3U95_05410 [Mycolicibacterium senegalense]CDP85316.1 hypothetical protein BN975_02181 [Mycolicibacterium farcinogenes]SUA27829.1 Uncharacterised protein [Mycolicibacterium senegalense]
MTRMSVLSGALLSAAGVAVSVVAAPVASAGADDVIRDLESQGYTVHINWTNGFDTKPLSECWVTGVNNPADEQPGPTTFVTVYVDVACPNHDY